MNAKQTVVFCSRGNERSVDSSCGMRFSELREVSGMEKRGQVELSDPYEYGYGPRVMKETKVCRHCGSKVSISDTFCTSCGSALRYEEV